MKLLNAIAVTVWIAGPVSAQRVVDGSDAGLPPEEVQRISRLVSGLASVPNVVEFRLLRQTSPGCYTGEVNLRGVQGAGFRWFMANPESDSASLLMTPGNELVGRNIEALADRCGLHTPG